MKIIKEEVEHVAMLSRLTLSESELAQMQQDLSEILEKVTALDHMEQGNSAECADCPPCQAFREDIVIPSWDREQLLRCAPVHRADSIVVPKTVE